MPPILSEGQLSPPGAIMPFCRRIVPLLCVSVLSALVVLAEPTPAAGDAGNLLKAGKEAFKKGRAEEAIGLFTQAIAADANNIEVYKRRAAAFAMLNRADEALQDMAEAMRLEPANRDHLLDRARIYETLGRLEDAIQDCTSSIAMKRDGNAFILRAQ